MKRDKEPLLADREVSEFELANALDAMAASLGMDPALTDAYKRENLSFHNFNLPHTDKDYHSAVAQEVLSFADNLPAMYQYLVQKDVWKQHTDDETPLSRKAQREFNRNTYKALRKRDNTEVISVLKKRGKFGMLSSVHLSYIFLSDQIHYYFNPMPDDDPPLRRGFISQVDLEILFDEEELASGITVEKVARKQLERGHIDNSQEMLDKRFDVMTKRAQLEMFYIIVEVLDEIGRHGSNKGNFVKSFLDNHGNILLQDDLPGTIEAMTALAQICRQYAISESNLEHKKIMQLLGGYTNSFADHINLYLAAYKEIYEAFGYPLPDLLQETPKSSHALGAKALKETVEVDDIEEDTYTQDLLEAQRLKESLREVIDELLGQWRLSTKQRKARDFGSLHKALVSGYIDTLGNTVINGIPKERAQIITDALNFLERSAASITLEGARDKVEYLQDLEEEIENEAERLEELIESKGLPASLRLERYPSFRDSLAHLRSNWEAYKTVIKATWPILERVGVVERIEPLLFSPQKITESLPVDHMPDPPDLFASNYHESLIEQLDILVLPPHPTTEDIQRELERIGVDIESVRKIEHDRLFDLAAIRERFNGTLYRSKERSLGGAPPYYVAVLEIEGYRYAIAESPVFGNATYVVSEKHAPGSWLEMLELSKKEVRELGARRIIHTDSAAHGPAHVNKIYNVLFNLRSIEDL